MQAYVSKELGKDVIYLNPMFITERSIVGYEIPDHSENLANLSEEEKNNIAKIRKSSISTGWECTSLTP
jgi:hypothetical protein